ncbi:hypothetical protein BABINDRAFT_109765 [Babjeviella inositovora NRRL Y-12698]|uniref:Uncharacterized protein n=1 Tax=Babjeviella inositovora NRRL Y-12698 TaxID=984486 RepID=A0A1E3QVG8_9ASCO|nr:uncharacterized protein BABINDRAFT_109765 [Babjeviella inositovora NRRL Y-12698]ODQ81643.1 hypothetical protein BABINDRAFT_109765 [Babjeviella inositovora NRRL Y-12698]
MILDLSWRKLIDKESHENQQHNVSHQLLHRGGEEVPGVIGPSLSFRLEIVRTWKRALHFGIVIAWAASTTLVNRSILFVDVSVSAVLYVMVLGSQTRSSPYHVIEVAVGTEGDILINIVEGLSHHQPEPKSLKLRNSFGIELPKFYER